MMKKYVFGVDIGGSKIAAGVVGVLDIRNVSDFGVDDSVCYCLTHGLSHILLVELQLVGQRVDGQACRELPEKIDGDPVVFG